MSFLLSNLLGHPDDPREIQLIKNILEKTREGKIRWTKQGSALIAKIPNGLQINFVIAPLLGILAADVGRDLLTVRDKNGNELLKVVRPGLIPAISDVGRGPVVAAADELFKAVHGAASDKLDRAIDEIRNL